MAGQDDDPRAPLRGPQVSREWLESVLDRMPDGFFILDAVGRYTYVNAAAAAASGTVPANLLGKTIWELAPQIVGSPFHEACTRVQRTGETTAHFDLCHDYGDRQGWYDLTIFPFEDGVAVHFRDITARKTAEEALQRFRFMVEQSMEEIYLARPDGSLAYVNEAAARSLGYDREEMIRLGIPGFDPQGGPLFRRHFEQLRSGGVPAFETVHVARDGRRIVKEVRAVYVRMGAEEYVAGFGHDITARKEAERRTARSLEVERALREIDRDIIAGAGLQETLGAICRSVVAIGYRLCWVGLAEPDGIVRPAAWAGEGPETEYPATIRVRWDDTPEGRGPTGTAVRTGLAMTVEDTLEDQRYWPWRAQAARLGLRSSVALPLPSEGGEVLGALNAYRARAGRFAEEELQTLATFAGQCALAILTARRRTALRDAERQLGASQRMETVGTLAGGIAHDFNNLLTGIVGFANLARERVAGNPAVTADLDEVLHNAERASTLTRQLLTFARRQAVAPARVDLNELVADLLKLVRRVIGEHLELVVRPSPGAAVALLDRGQFEQVIMNLCVNARDAMPQGGTLGVEVFAEPGGAAGGIVGVRVTDTGVGIPEAIRDRIFEPFFTTKPQGQGTGLGLSVSYGIVRQHGGSIAVRSGDGRGTVFEIRLPATAGAADATPPVEAAPARGGHETVLVADDEPLIRDLASRVLAGLGYRVLVAADGEEAVTRFCEAGGADLVLLDAVMPRLPGPLAWERLRALRPDLRVLFMSGYAGNAADPAADPFLGAPFLAKPFGPTDLARKVREVLDGPPPGP